LICIELQPRTKSRGFEDAYIRSHPLPVTFHLFLPQICHSDFAHASARLSGNDAEYIVVARHGRPVKVDQISVQGLLMNEPTASGQERSFLTIMCSLSPTQFVAGLWQMRIPVIVGGDSGSNVGSDSG
jgi:hypothetical protein